MNNILRIYEAVLLIIIYIIIAGYSVRAMLDLIEQADSISSLLNMILLDTFWMTLIIILGALIVSLLFKHKTRK
jgi:uncharacterized membrane protein